MDPTYTGAVPGSPSTTISVTTAWDFLQVLLAISIAALIVLALISALVGWMVAGRVLKPLKAINAAATLAATGSLDHRVGLQGPHGEIRDLSDTFDRMLGVLDLSFAAHRRFAANASHELRTPLATTQTMIDVTLADPDADTTSSRNLAERIDTVNRANMRTVESLLDLADIGHRSLSREPVDLSVLAADTIDTYISEARDREITITLHPAHQGSPRPVALGDPVLLRHTVRNLVQNAIRHNHPSGTVDIRTSNLRDTVMLTVTNTGAHVPSDIVGSLHEPFVRAAGRTTNPDGTRGRGLGLAIAASVAEAHNGSLRLAANDDGGLIAKLTLPR